MVKKYDAIVIGSGISGGWAAKELTEAGLKTLVLERGRSVTHGQYPTALLEDWEIKNNNLHNPIDLTRQYKQNRASFVTEPARAHWFVDDVDHPYLEKKRFDWIRGYHVGGRSITWGRHCYRLSDLDFEANLKDGHGVDWPIRYKDIKQWYDKVEDFIGISGEAMGLPHLPDGNFLKPFMLNYVEEHFKDTIKKEFGRHLTMGRVANFTEGTKTGRANCMGRNKCMRGCPLGGYFSSLSSTLPAAERTGNMTLRPNSVVHEIVYDDNTGKATGVKVIDAVTMETMFFEADVIFCCASAINSAAILLQSRSKRFPNGLGNDSGELGCNIMDHHLLAGATATLPIDPNKEKYVGGRPNDFYIPRFTNLPGNKSEDSFVRGYGYQGAARYDDWKRAVAELSFGKKMKAELLNPEKWNIGMIGFGEMLPNHNNKMTLRWDKRDKWGLPLVEFDVEYGENEKNMRKSMLKEAVAMFEAAGFDDVKPLDIPVHPGIGIHEMGTARMGRDPKTSVLNKHNQLHAVPNVYVTDGACMTSSANQNPSFTYMALTARAAAHAVAQLKKERG